MITKFLAFLTVLLLPFAARSAYIEKDDTSTNRTVLEPVPPPDALLAPAKEKGPLPPGRYPYYGNVPDDMLPFRRIDPYFKYWEERLPFRGPGRDYPDPLNLKSLKVGLLSPAPYGPEGRRGDMSRKGVMLAFEEANAARKPGEFPFEIIERLDMPLWGSAANLAVEFADNDVLGIIGTIDGDATHVALRVALKIETFMINASDPDPSLTETQIPWLLRVFPDDRQQGYRLAELLVKERGYRRIVVFRVNNRPGRVGVRPFVDAVRRLGRPIVQELRFKEGDRNFEQQVAVVREANPDAIVFWGNPPEIGPAAAQIRAAGVKADFFGCDRLLDDVYLKAAGAAAEGTTVTYFFDTNKTDQAWTQFVEKFQKRHGIRPDIYAAYGYDGAQLLLDAIRKAGPNRYRVHDVLANLEEYDGVTGHLRFDGRWDNIAPLAVAQYKQGKWKFEPPKPATKLSQK